VPAIAIAELRLVGVAVVPVLHRAFVIVADDGEREPALGNDARVRVAIAVEGNVGRSAHDGFSFAMRMEW